VFVFVLALTAVVLVVVVVVTVRFSLTALVLVVSVAQAAANAVSAAPATMAASFFMCSSSPMRKMILNKGIMARTATGHARRSHTTAYAAPVRTKN
jgi:hypothetical protein